jgi:hypothetical protein
MKLPPDFPSSRDRSVLAFHKECVAMIVNHFLGASRQRSLDVTRTCGRDRRGASFSSKYLMLRTIGYEMLRPASVSHYGVVQQPG